MITITYGGSDASVSGDYYGYVSVKGNAVTVNNTGTENIVYKLTGSASNGSFKLYSEKKQAILLSDLTLTNPDGAVLNNQREPHVVTFRKVKALHRHVQPYSAEVVRSPVDSGTPGAIAVQRSIQGRVYDSGKLLRQTSEERVLQRVAHPRNHVSEQ
jgi:hypothetical protein